MERLTSGLQTPEILPRYIRIHSDQQMLLGQRATFCPLKLVKQVNNFLNFFNRDAYVWV